MASQDGQPDRILRGCTQPTLAQDLPEPAAGPPAAGALEAAAGPPARRWCFGGGGCAARDRRAHALRLLRAPGGSAASRGRRVCPRRRSWPSIPASHRTAAAEPRQPLEVGDGGGRVQGDPAAVSVAHDAVEPRRALPAHSGVAAPWLHSRTGQEGQLRGTSPTWTHLPARDTRPRSCRISSVTCGGRRSCRQVSSSRQASSQRSGRQAPSQPRQPPQLPASFQALFCQTPQRPCRCQPASCAVSHQRPSRCQAGRARPPPPSGPAAAKPARARPPPPSGPAAASCPRPPSGPAAPPEPCAASRIALSQHFCACARVVPFCNFVCYTFCEFSSSRSHFLWKKE